MVLTARPSVLRSLECSTIRCVFRAGSKYRRGLSTGISPRTSHEKTRLLSHLQTSNTLPSLQSSSESRLKQNGHTSRIAYMLFGGAITLAIAAGGVIFYFRKHINRVPITNRQRIMWYNEEHDEINGHNSEYRLRELTGAGSVQLGEDSASTKLVREILEKLLQVEEVKQLQVNPFVYDSWDEPFAMAVLGLRGGKIFINTFQLALHKTPGQLAGDIAHELAHILARHGAEKCSSRFFAVEIAKWFGFKGHLGDDLLTSRQHELEADRIGLILMASAGFDPQERLDAFSADLERELQGKSRRIIEFLSTHPSHENRLKEAKRVLPEARRIFECMVQEGRAPAILQNGDASKKEVKSFYLNHKSRRAEQAKLQPAPLLKDINQRISQAEHIALKSLQTISERTENLIAGTQKNQDSLDRRLADIESLLLQITRKLEISKFQDVMDKGINDMPESPDLLFQQKTNPVSSAVSRTTDNEISDEAPNEQSMKQITECKNGVSKSQEMAGEK